MVDLSFAPVAAGVAFSDAGLAPSAVAGVALSPPAASAFLSFLAAFSYSYNSLFASSISSSVKKESIPLLLLGSFLDKNLIKVLTSFSAFL